MHIELGDNERYIAIKIGTFTFQMDLRAPLRLKVVMFILGITKNIIFVVVLEECGYDVIFS